MKRQTFRTGFTLIEMMVVVGIIAILLSAGLVGFSKARASAERAKLNELVSQTATALETIFDADGAWPKLIRTRSQGEGLVDEKVAWLLGCRGLMSVTSGSDGKAGGLDRFGIVTPWARDAIKSAGESASLNTVVSRSKEGPSTVKDHILRFRVDYNGDGIIEDVPIGGESVNIRGVVAVWSGGKDGKIEAYSRGQRGDDVYSWGKGQTREVK